MSITERERRDLYEGLEAALGPERSDTLMALLPLQPADELVTIAYFQTEMGALRAELRGEMAELRSELRGDMAELRGGMAELRGDMAELRGEMAELRSELRSDMATLRSDLEAKMTRWMAMIMTGNTVAVVTALVT